MVFEAIIFNRVIGGLTYPIWRADLMVARNYGVFEEIPETGTTFRQQLVAKTFQQRYIPFNYDRMVLSVLRVLPFLRKTVSISSVSFIDDDLREIPLQESSDQIPFLSICLQIHRTFHSP